MAKLTTAEQNRLNNPNGYVTGDYRAAPPKPLVLGYTTNVVPGTPTQGNPFNIGMMTNPLGTLGPGGKPLVGAPQGAGSGVNLGMVAGLGAGNAYNPPPLSDLDQLIALINAQGSGSSGGGGGGGGGAAYPAFDSTPYDNAEAAGRTAAGDANTSIAQQYADLHAKLTSTAADSANQYAINKAQVGTNGAALQAALAALTQQGQAGLTAQGVNPAISNPFNAEMAARQGQAQVSTDNRSSLADRLAQVAAQGATSRQSDASGAEAAGHATTAASLSALLGQIGQSKGTALAQYNQAAAAAAAAAARSSGGGGSSGMSDLDKAMKIYDLKQKAAAGDHTAAADQAKLLQSMQTTPRQDLESQLSTTDPSDPTAKTFWSIIDEAKGSGAQGLHSALTAADAMLDQNGRPAPASPAVRQMISSYYDTTTKRVNPAALKVLGG